MFVLVLIAVSIGVLVDRHFGSDVRTGIIEYAHRGLDGLKYHGKTFAVANVVDGDTLDIDVPDGPNKFTRIRLLGIDTPETKDPRVEVMFYGPEASAFAKELTEKKPVRVILDTVGDVRDIYGRLLGYIQLDDGRVLNEELIVNGFGYADLRFNHSQYDRYVALQQRAMNAQAGLWREVSREQLPSWLQRLRPDLPADH